MHWQPGGTLSLQAGFEQGFFSSLWSLFGQSQSVFETRAYAVPPCAADTFTAILGPTATVNNATFVSANSSLSPLYAGLEFPTVPSNLPQLCAVSINVKSSDNSAFNFGLLLPEEWNQEFMTTGNGGFGGGINWPDMGPLVQYGFATMSTDTGHLSGVGDGTWALNQPETITDWTYRAMHGSVVLAKQVIQGYYASTIQHSYYAGCSTGGRQGLKEIEMYPEDFDGVLVGAPAWWTTHLQTWTLEVALHNLPIGAPNHIAPPLFAVIQEEIMRQCDPQDGVTDNIIMDPYGCNFYPETLLCTPSTPNSTNATCLTPAQLSTLYHIYTDYIETNQTFVFPHLTLGADPTPLVSGGLTGTPNPLGTSYLQNFIHNSSTWPWQSYTYADVLLADALDPGHANADAFANLSTFAARGGKVIMYHGLADPLIPTGSSVYFYKSVLNALTPSQGINLDTFFRLFLIPGMGHCASSEVAPWYIAAAGQVVSNITHGLTPPDEDARHDAVLALKNWVEEGTAPDSIVATKYVDDDAAKGVERQRVLCPFPAKAVYVAGGNVDQADSWVCKGV